MNKSDRYHIDILTNIMDNGMWDKNPRPKYKDGVSAHTLSINGIFTQYDLNKNEFPFHTLRPIAWKSAIKEILWIYQDQTSDLSVLREKYNITWWDQWESKEMPGTIGQRYGATVKQHDLMNKLLDGLITNPNGRRHIMNLWQEEDFIESDGLMPCCYETLWNVRGNFLDMTLVQRSSDFITAGAINEIQYVALQLMVAKHCGYIPGRFSHLLNNVQIYDRHLTSVMEILERTPLPQYPVLVLCTDKTNFYDFTIDDFKVLNYNIDMVRKKNPQMSFELAI